MTGTQQSPWAGSFGTEYHERNIDTGRDEIRRIRWWRKVIWEIRHEVTSCIEFGAGKGENYAALDSVLPRGKLDYQGIEINHQAVAAARELDREVRFGDLCNPDYPLGVVDMVFTRGFLIHVPPESIDLVLRRMYEASRLYIVIAEYYAPTQTEVKYRGQDGMLWRNDFAGMLLDRYKDLQLKEYGFTYHRDPYCAQDDLTHFILEKTG